MRNIFYPFLLIFFASCGAVNYYQIYKTMPQAGIVFQDKIVFEDNNCIVTYNLWSNGGDMGFIIFNKTQGDLKLHLDNSFFILNGVAHPYFQNRTFTKSTSHGIAVSSGSVSNSVKGRRSESIGLSSSSSVAYNEQPEIIIPGGTQIVISEFLVTSGRYVDCDLPKFPKSGAKAFLKYDESDSPFVFSNLLTYSTVKDTVRFENKFFVNEIGNYASTELFHRVDTTSCGVRRQVPKLEFRNTPSNEFYISYSKK